MPIPEKAFYRKIRKGRQEDRKDKLLAGFNSFTTKAAKVHEGLRPQRSCMLLR